MPSTHGGSRAGPNLHLVAKIAAVWATTDDMGKDGNESAKTQLDSHSNMVVVGSHATIFGQSGKSADVRPFSNDCSKLESFLIVDAAVDYD